MKFLDNRPIIACSTGNFANTAIAVIRLSGFSDLHSLQSFFNFDLSKVKNRYAHLVDLLDNGMVVDNCLLTFFPAGKSFTGENTLELQVHGNQLNVSRILNLFINKADFRSADPGEFSYRAFQNKKLSLSQVEGLDLFLNASNSMMLEQGLDILQGQLHQSYLRLYELYLKLKSAVELLIDFSEDVGEDYARESYFSLLAEFKKLSESLHLRSQGQISSLLNPEVVIVGETNAGKSSFFNILLKNERSIVSNIKGTTRDYISETISINSNYFSLVDTAGIRETFDEIEKIGISRSLEKIKSAFFRILLVNPFHFDENYLSKLGEFEFDLLILTHMDLADKNFDFSLEKFHFLKFKNFIFCNLKSDVIGPIGPKSKSGSIGPETKSGSIGPETKSGSIGPEAKSGSIGPVVFKFIDQNYSKEREKNPILLERHRHKINELHSYLTNNFHNISDLDDLAITSSEINRLGVALSELIGQVSAEDVLNSVFSNFCIGK